MLVLCLHRRSGWSQTRRSLGVSQSVHVPPRILVNVCLAVYSTAQAQKQQDFNKISCCMCNRTIPGTGGPGIGADGLCKRPRSFEIRPIPVYRICVYHRAPVNGMLVRRSAPLPSGVQDQMEYVMTWGSFWAGLQLGHTGRNGTRLPRNQRKQDRTREKKMDAPTPSTPPAAAAVTWQCRPDVDCCVMGPVSP